MKRCAFIYKLRHFRGHGIHSPFVYGLKREVFMRKYVPGENNQLFNTLTASGVDKKVARELQNVHNYCNFPMFEFVNDNKTDYPVGSEVFYILEKGVTPEELEVLLAGSAKVSVAVLDKKLALKANSGNITIERSRYAIIFKNAGLPVKTFKL